MKHRWQKLKKRFERRYTNPIYNDLDKREKKTFRLAIDATRVIRLILLSTSGCLFFFSTKTNNNFSNYGDGSFSLSISSILPFITYIHVGWFSLALNSTFKGTNSLSFSLSKMTILYLSIHSFWQIIISIIFGNYYIYEYYYSKNHKFGDIQIFHYLNYYIKYPIFLIPILINFILFICCII